MAWTEPRTWATGDPLVASTLNTQIRDNQRALRVQTQDAESKLGKHHPAYLSPLLVGYAVIGIDGSVQVTSTSAVVWHAKCKLTFTPKSDFVLIGAQFSFGFYHNDPGKRGFVLGFQKDGAAVSLSHTDSISGTLGSESDIAFEDLNDRNLSYLAAYQAPVSVTRDTEVSFSPTVRVTSGVTAILDNPSVMILTALDVGSYE